MIKRIAFIISLSVTISSLFGITTARTAAAAITAPAASAASASSTAAVVSAQAAIEIYLNGSLLQSDVPPVLKDDRTFVPIRVIGEALGYTVGYDDGVVKMQHGASGAYVEMTVGVPSATINGKTVDLPVPAFIENGRTLAPVRFLSEALDSKVDWEPGYESPDRVIINCPFPVSTYGGKTQIASRSESFSVEIETEWHGKDTIEYNINIPIFTIPGHDGLANELNDELSSMADSAIADVKREYASHFSGEYESNGYSEDCIYYVVFDDGHILSVLLNGYVYYGGAHGMPYIIAYNLDLDKGISLTLADIFKPGIDYEKILFQRMTSMIAAMPIEYEDVRNPDFLEAGSFYFDGNDLVIYYHPYNLSSFARGFVEFRIALPSLSEYIKDEYQ